MTALPTDDSPADRGHDQGGPWGRRLPEAAEATSLLTRLIRARFDPAEPGAAVGLYLDGELQAEVSCGMACLEHAVPIGPSTRFNLASVSKQLTAACLLLMARDRDLLLDVDVRRWVPELRPGGITLWHCLHHTTGLPDYLADDVRSAGPAVVLSTPDEFLSWLGSVAGTEFAPGSAFSYSNSGYVLAAIIASRATGTPFGALMRERVFDPLGMNASGLHDAAGLVVPSLAFSYHKEPTGGWSRAELTGEQVGDGAVLSTLQDLAAWHGFLVDGRHLGRDVRDGLRNPAVLIDGRKPGYGAGVRLSVFEGMPLLEHSGGMFDYRTHLLSVPELGLGITVLSNLGATDAAGLANEVLRATLLG